MKEIHRKLKKEGTLFSGNEYQVIEDVITHNQEARALMEQELSKQQKTVKRVFLHHWLDGKIQTLDKIEDNLDSFKMSFDGDTYAVMLFVINEFEYFETIESAGDNFEMARFILMNILGEKLEPICQSEVGEKDDVVFAILNFYDGDEDIEFKLHRAYEELTKILEEHFGMDITISISSRHESLVGVVEAYNEANEAIAYNHMLGQVKVIRYEEVVDTKRQYEYTLDAEYKLINLIRLGHGAEAQEVVKSIIDSNTKETLLSIESLECLMFDVMGSLMKSIKSEKEQEYINGIRPIRTLMNIEDVKKMEDYVLEVIEGLSQVIAEGNEKKENESNSDQILAFIQEHYEDPDLNLAYIGEAFQLSPPYVSKIFKQKMGITIPNLIQSIRVEGAKELLEHTDDNIGTIAEKVGYLHSNVFIRVFKKITGMTPGQYRTMKS